MPRSPLSPLNAVTLPTYERNLDAAVKRSPGGARKKKSVTDVRGLASTSLYCWRNRSALWRWNRIAGTTVQVGL